MFRNFFVALLSETSRRPSARGAFVWIQLKFIAPTQPLLVAGLRVCSISPARSLTSSIGESPSYGVQRGRGPRAQL
jgi:hypothetical protein